MKKKRSLPRPSANLVADTGGKVSFIFEDDRPFAQCHASTITQAPDGTIIAAWFAGNERKRCGCGHLDVPTQRRRLDSRLHWQPKLKKAPTGTPYFSRTRKASSLSFLRSVRKFLIGARTGCSLRTTASPGQRLANWFREMMAAAVPSRTNQSSSRTVPGLPLHPRNLAHGNPLRTRPPTREKHGNALKTFQINRDILRGKGAIQPTLWESDPGKVHALLRTASGNVWRTDSEDYGATWSPVYVIGLPNNNSGLDVLRLEDGQLLLVLNPVGMNWGPRTPLSLALSCDNGLSWTLVAHLEDDPIETKHEYSYPAIIRTKSGIAISYTWRRERVRCWLIDNKALTNLTTPCQ